MHPGGSAREHTHWVFPVVTTHGPALIKSLRRAGFDSATKTSGIAAVAPPRDRPELAPAAAELMMAGVVFLPVYPELRVPEVERLLAAAARGGDNGR